MTSRQLYEGVLIELNKENAPNILLEDFNYFANKAVNQYINKRYNIYDINLQTTDDLRVLKANIILTPKRISNYDGLSLAHNATYYVDLPSDYLHLLNCICIYNVKKSYKCYNKGDTWRAAATRLTADAYSQVLDNFWLKPTYKRPYYYIHNINQYDIPPTNPYNKQSGIGTDNPEVKFLKSGFNEYDGHSRPIAEDWAGLDEGIELRRSGSLSNLTFSTVQRSAGLRYGNVSKVRLEIRYGTDNSIFTLDQTYKDANGVELFLNPIKNDEGNFVSKGGYVYIDYIKTPLHIRLTQEQLDWTEDKSLVLEFPDYVCQEILNELVHIIMETISDPRIQTHPVVSLSIANPAQALAPETAGQSAK